MGWGNDKDCIGGCDLLYIYGGRSDKNVNLARTNILYWRRIIRFKQ